MTLAEVGNSDISLAIAILTLLTIPAFSWLAKREIEKREKLQEQLAAADRDTTRKVTDLERLFAVLDGQRCDERLTKLETVCTDIRSDMRSLVESTGRMEHTIDKLDQHIEKMDRHRRVGDEKS